MTHSAPHPTLSPKGRGLSSFSLSPLGRGRGEGYYVRDYVLIKLYLFLSLVLLTTPVLADPPAQLTIGLTGIIDSVNPLQADSAPEKYLQGFVQQAIFITDKDGLLQCQLCTELPSLDNGLVARQVKADEAPRLAVTIRLKSGLLWGDGTPVTSDDMRFTWQLSRYPNIMLGNRQRALLDRIIDMSIEDSRTFTLYLQPADDRYLYLQDLFLLPMHSEKFALANPNAYASQSRYNLNATDAGLYNGAYQIDVLKEDGITLKQNPSWRGTKPAVQTLVIKVYPHAEALLDAVKAGKVDIVPLEAGLDPENIMRLADMMNPATSQFVYAPTRQFVHIDLRYRPEDKDAPLNNPTIRKALLQGIDRASINRLALQNHYYVTDTFLPAALRKGITEPSALPVYDMQAANLALDKTSWLKKADGMRYNKAGKPLSFTFYTIKDDALLESLQQFVRNDLLKLGIQVEVRNAPRRVLFQDILPKGQFDMAITSWLSPFTSLPSSRLLSTGKKNYSGWKNPALDTLYQKTVDTLEPQTRLQVFADIEAVYQKDLPFLPLYFAPGAAMLPKDLQGYTLTPYTTPASAFVTDWTWPASKYFIMQKPEE